MKVKIICMAISILFICGAIPATLGHENDVKQEYIENSQIEGYFIFGFMKLIDPDESISEFEVVSFVMLIGNGEKIRLDEGEMVKIYEPIIGVIYNNLFIGLIGDYSIIG